ncbi:hypothetical protein JCM9279_004374 [Rhodotorula babjevae]
MVGSGSSERRPGEVGSITALKSQPRADEALDLLRKIASLVKPIMRKHGWFLPTLSEFFPKNPNLLGVNSNGGMKICIRLRPQHDPSSFLPLEDSLIGTMLHELTHNVRGPHDDVFFKQLDALQDEYDELRAKGYSGEGFLGDGRRVGEGVGHDKGVSVREAREKALRNFEERERVRKVLGTGGRLGGAAPDTKGRRMADVLADAAERRQRAKKTCGGDDAHDHPSGSSKADLPPEVQDDINRAERDSRTVVLDLTEDSGDEDDALIVVAGPSGSSSRTRVKPDPDGPDPQRSSSPELEVLPAKRSADRPSSPPNKRRAPSAAAARTSSGSRAPSSSATASTASLAPPARGHDAPRARCTAAPAASTSSAAPRAASTSTSTSNSSAWPCALCTYLNPSALSLTCAMCLTARPSSTLPPARRARVAEDDGWECHACSTVNGHVFWSCSTCGTVKTSSAIG